MRRSILLLPAVAGLALPARRWALAGKSGHRRGAHCDDEASQYAKGQWRPIHGHNFDWRGHIESEYQPDRGSGMGARTP